MRSAPLAGGTAPLVVVLGLVALWGLSLPAAAHGFGRPAPSRPGDGQKIVRPSIHSTVAAAGPVVGGAIRDLDTGLAFATIQDAIDDPTTLAGNTLEVGVAAHSEGPVVVSKSLTLQGASGSEVILMTQDTGASGDARGWFLVEPGIELHVRDLTFDGNGFRVFQAFRDRGTGSFERCRFRDIRYNESGPDFAGTAIVAFGGDVDVRACTFESIGREGILLFGGGITGAVIEGNLYTGKGDGTFLDYGVELGAGAMATLSNNTVTDCRGVATDGSTSAAILVSTFFGPGTGATVTSNTLLASTVGLQVGFDATDGSAVTASFNRIVGNAFGLDSTSGSVTTAAGSDWWGCNGGPGTAGCDTVTGLADADPWLLLSLAASPASVLAGGSSALTASLTGNSDGADTSALGTVPDGIPVGFAAAPGGVMLGTGATAAGRAASQFNAGGTAGNATVTAEVDNQTVSIEVAVAANPVAVPALGPWGLLVLVVMLVSAAVVLIARLERPHR